MGSIVTSARWALAAALTCAAAAVQAQEGKGCALLLMHGQAGAPQTLAALARKLQPACVARVPEMPWSAKRSGDKDAAGALQEIARHVKELRQQGYKRIVLAGHGLGANAAIAYAAEVGDVDGVVAMGGVAAGAVAGWGELPALAPRMRQHIPLLWVVGEADPLHKLGEAYAFAKAPPHPSSRYLVVKADAAGTPEAAARPMLDWLKEP